MAENRALTITQLAGDSNSARLGTRVTRMPSDMLANSSFDRDETAKAAPAE